MSVTSQVRTWNRHACSCGSLVRGTADLKLRGQAAGAGPECPYLGLRVARATSLGSRIESLGCELTLMIKVTQSSSTIRSTIRPGLPGTGSRERRKCGPVTRCALCIFTQLPVSFAVSLFLRAFLRHPTAQSIVVRAVRVRRRACCKCCAACAAYLDPTGQKALSVPR
eukprot:686063-Rhodomonas_salina.4